MSTRSVLCKLVLVSVLLCFAAMPCVSVQAAGFGAPDVEGTFASWIQPVMEWLGWDDGDQAVWGAAQGNGTGTGASAPTSSLDDYDTTTEEDDRGTVIDPNG